MERIELFKKPCGIQRFFRQSRLPQLRRLEHADGKRSKLPDGVAQEHIRYRKVYVNANCASTKIIPQYIVAAILELHLCALRAIIIIVPGQLDTGPGVIRVRFEAKGIALRQNLKRVVQSKRSTPVPPFLHFLAVADHRVGIITR